MRRKLITLSAALALAAGAAHATPPASAEDGIATFARTDDAALKVLVDRASAGDLSAVLEAAKEAAQAGDDPLRSPFVDAVTDAYLRSSGPASAVQAMADRAAAGDPSAVFEAERQAQLGGVGSTPETEAVAKAWEETGEARWQADILSKIRSGDLTTLFSVIRSAALAFGDYKQSPFAQKASDAFDQYVAHGPPSSTSDRETDHAQSSTSGADGNRVTGPPDAGDPPTGGSSDEGSKGEPKTQSWKVTDYDANGNKTGEGTKTVTTDPDGTTTTVKDMHYTDGSTTKTTSVDDGDTVTTTDEITDADGNVTTVTTTCDADDPDCAAELTNPDAETNADPTSDALDRPTLHEMQEHPTNDPENTGTGPTDVDWDGRPDLEPGHLDGVIDPAPDTVELVADVAPDTHTLNLAGPEYVPELQGELGPVAPQGNGPIENDPQGLFRP